MFPFFGSILFAILFANQNAACQSSGWTPGSGTWYSSNDQFQSDWVTGTGRCWGPSSYRPDIPCFDSISYPYHIAAVNTRGMTYTQTIGTCVAVTCVNGPIRGLPYSKYPWPGCLGGNNSVLVQISDSCPGNQNESNQQNCANNPLTAPRHFDLSEPAFGLIGDTKAGTIDVLYQQVPCPAGDVTGVSWKSWEAKYGQTIQAWSQSKFDTLTTVESACDVSTESASIAGLLAEDESNAANKTLVEAEAVDQFAEENGLNVTELLNLQRNRR